MQRITLVVVLACVAVAIFFAWHRTSKVRPDVKSIALVQDEVYEAVVRGIIATTGGANIRQLALEENVATGLGSESVADLETCKSKVRQDLYSMKYTPPPFNSLADKLYRFWLSGNWNDYRVQEDTIEDFLAKACTGGRLSETFHTDLPRTFIASDSLYFHGGPNPKNGSSTFEQLFPGAAGITSFSHAGFNRNLNQAIVYSSFVCGGLCASGTVYVLKKRRRGWQIVKQWLVWES